MKLQERIYGCWLGKSIGGTLGLPAEGMMERLNFAFYDPIPTTAPPNDDLELQLVWLHLIETSEASLTQSDFARAWLQHIHYMWDEYGRTRWNLRRGVPVEDVGAFENHFHAGMGSPIRSEIWACLFPNDPDSAAHYAALDASLDHSIEGIAGEVFFAVMQSEVAAGRNLNYAIKLGLQYIPKECETARAVEFVLQAYDKQTETWACWKELLERHGNESFTHAPLNIGLTIWALIYGECDFEKSVLLAVNGGYDTDCTAATVGATLGFILGESGIPQRWKDPIGQGVFVGPGILDISSPETLTELTERTVAVLNKLQPMPWDNSRWEQSAPPISLSDLPGNITLQPVGGQENVIWANGELPPVIKQSGGAQWTWVVSTDEPREITCLVREGAKLFVNDTLAIECPAGLPYVPAPHRTADGSRVSINPGIGTHVVRLELNSCSPIQDASIILTYPNFHLCPWTQEELPHFALLPERNQTVEE